MRFRLIWAIFLTIGLTFSHVTAADLSVDIVPESSGGKDKQGINIWRTFFVILTNTSDHKLSVWNEECSWGYFNLSFEFTGKDGKVFRTSKNPIGFTVNFPSGYVVLPGKHFVLAVAFRNWVRKDIRDWSNTEKLDGTMTMKAIYKNTNEAFPGEKPNPLNKYSDVEQKLFDSAWVGEAQSEPIQVTIER
jgi:hypothetical protein